MCGAVQVREQVFDYYGFQDIAGEQPDMDILFGLIKDTC
jgi:hypothetical protein